LQQDVARYLDELADRSACILGDRLLGVYAGGSLALGAYEPPRSDVDVALVVESQLERAEKEALVDALRHESLPCPARGLELVAYTRAAAAAETVDADFELNLNTGRAMTSRVDFEPDPAETFWFAVDRAILRGSGVAVRGPRAAEVFGQIPRGALLSVVARSLRWHLDGPAAPDDAVLNACRSLRFARESAWSAKREAGEWAVGRVARSAVVESALRARDGDEPPSLEEARAFVRDVLAEVEEA